MADEPDLVVSAGFSDAQLVKEANKVVAFYKKRGEEAQKAFLDAQGKVTNTQAANAHKRDMDRLASAYDPAYRAAKKYEKSVAELSRAFKGGALDQKQYIAATERAARQLKQAGEVGEEAGRKMAGGGNSMQQFGWQIGDFAVQVGAGTSIAQAAGQQLPQLLGAFGAVGAMAGAATAILIPLGAALLKAGDASAQFDDKLKLVTEATDLMKAAVEAAETPIAVLTARYGEAAGAAQEFFRQQSAVSQAIAAAALADLGKSVGGVGGKLGDNSQEAGWLPSILGAVSGVEVKTISDTQRKVQELMNTYRVGRSDAERMAVAMQAVMDAGGDAGAALTAAEGLNAVLIEVAGGADKVGAKFGGKDGLWGKVDAYFKQATAQSEALRSEQDRIIDQYRTHTEKLKSLSNDRKVAEEVLKEALIAGATAVNAKAVEAARLARERLSLIDDEIVKTKALALANDEVFIAMQKRIAAGAGGFFDGLVERATGTSLTQWGKDGAAAQKGILELIAQRESGGDYNATLDNGRWTGGARNLVNMTLKEILALQSSMRTPENRALYGNGQGSSALGRYQIVGTTLEGLIKDLGLTGNELFSPEMQDRLAEQLLRQIKPGDVSGIRGVWAGLNNVPAPVIQQAWGQQSIERVDPEVQKELDKEIKDRERLAEQAKKYGQQLQQNLLTEQETAKLAAAQASQISAIKAQGLKPEDEARAITQVTAEIEKQKTVMMLMADAKRRNVDLDAMMAGTTTTYRQAIEALGEAKAADIIATNDRALAEGRAADAQRLMADAQAQVKNGLIDSIIAGESFADVLGNIAQMFAKAALQAALFNEGPWASGGGGSGILGGLISSAFGGFRANGGSVSAGTAYVVGEKQPELFVPGVSGTVLNADQVNRAMGKAAGSAGSITFSPSTSIVVQGNADERTLAQLQRDLDQRDAKLRRQIPAIMKRYNLTDG
ncbi:hypothetical protein [Paracoccus sp. (in: a-proteobacteria)]|uniref:hypothetical protein n=1 Tax=Paracoccus sp. TaxID=267 RepID=UPI002897F7B8|nr:hypothetical protein [Paracoccus sp. (in: a-proteobacteria)]